MTKVATICHFDASKNNKTILNSNRKAPRRHDLEVRKVKALTPRKKRATAFIMIRSEMSDHGVLIDLPLRTRSEANCFERWQVRYARHKEQQRVVFLSLNPLREKIKLPCRIMLTRFAPDELDKFDNLPMSFKYIVDAICAVITGEYRAGKADSDKRISIACDQVKSKAYGIRIEIFF